MTSAGALPTPAAVPGDEFDEWAGAWSREVPQDPDELSAWQLDRAWSIAEAAGRDNPFYRERLALPPDRDEAGFRRLAFTRKDDIVADCQAFPPFGGRSTVPPSEVRMIVQTSGTSGRGVEVFPLDQASLDAIVRIEAVGFLWAGVEAGTTVALTIPIGMSAAGLWYSAALRFLGANLLSLGPYPTSVKVEIMRRYGARVLVGTPSYVHRLAVACEDGGVDPASLGVDTLVVAGEPYSQRWAEDIERRWGAVLYEQYGCTERAIAWTCPGGVLRSGRLGVLHFPPEGGLCEVVDPVTGEPAGGDGELVVTPFGADSSPLVRYATGDKVRWVPAGACPCGRPLPGIVAGSVERYDDMIKIRGVNIWPVQFDEAVFAVPGVTDYRGVVTTDAGGREVVRITVEAPGLPPERTAAEVVEAVRERVGLATEVDVEAEGEMARRVPEGFVKIRRWRDERRARA